MSDRAKPESDYPTTEAWLADLDHSVCYMAEDVCHDIHCVYCGKSLGSGFVRCRCAGAVAAWGW